MKIAFARANAFARALTLVFLLLAGCVSGDGADNSAVVLERSGTFRPNWAKGDFSSEGEGPKYLTYQKKDITRLELGIKQAQAAAVEESCSLLKSRFEKEIRAAAERGSWKDLPLDQKLPSALAKLVESDKCPEAQPKFVYWELLRKDTGEGVRELYTIDVLLVVRRPEYRDSLFHVLSHLKSDSDPKMTEFVKEVAESYIDKEEE
jgi:hypothetical protein